MDLYPKDDAEWQAKRDFDALVLAEIAKADPARIKAAEAWGKKYMKAKMVEDKAEATIAGMSEKES